MRSLLAAWRLCRVALHALAGLATVLLRFPALDLAARRQRVQAWSAGLLACLGIELVVRGRYRPGAKLLVANHVSWLDITAVHAVCPEARFVSKAEVRHWPLVGRLVDAGDTLYIERERKRDALRVVHAMAEALGRGDTVAVFPEGTTGDGTALLPFHANLLQAAIAAQVPVQPLALRYAEPGQRTSTAAQWIGETTLVQSLWRIASARGLAVTVQVLTAERCDHADRRRLAEHLAEVIGLALEAPAADTDAPPGQAAQPATAGIDRPTLPPGGRGPASTAPSPAPCPTPPGPA